VGRARVPKDRRGVIGWCLGRSCRSEKLQHTRE
jgi:hypothetical protein